jgi:hypothetical protein
VDFHGYCIRAHSLQQIAPRDAIDHIAQGAFYYYIEVAIERINNDDHGLIVISEW